MSEAERTSAGLVERFLEASMIPDPMRAREFMALDVRITFTGGRRYGDPSESAAFNALRYRWVTKRFERTDVVSDAAAREAIVYSTGTLYGEWPDGRCFEGNGYVDRFVIRGGKIVRMDVWNDSCPCRKLKPAHNGDAVRQEPVAR